jgi:hypothetical protein
MRGFATDYLADYPGEKDWVCVEDFCGRCSTLQTAINVSAWWSPSRQITAFGNQWFDVPDMPGDEPGEDDVWTWVKAHPGFLQRRIDAAIVRDQAWKDKSKATDAFYAKWGAADVHYVFSIPGQPDKVGQEGAGIHGPIEMMRRAVAYMLEKLPPGSKLKQLRVYRRKPYHRGELP